MDRINSIIYGGSIQRGDTVFSIHSMSDFFAWLGHRLIALGIVLVIFLMVFEFLAPAYSHVIFSKKTRNTEGISALVSFKKLRNCTPVQGTAVAFLEYGKDFRLPVRLLNSKGEPLKLKKFPPSKTPISLHLMWESAVEVPNPDALVLSFDVTCITPIDQNVTWSSPVNFK